MGAGELSGKPDEMLGGNLAIDWYPIQGRISNTPSSFMEIGISSG